jgi:hypothetical protein
LVQTSMRSFGVPSAARRAHWSPTASRCCRRQPCLLACPALLGCYIAGVGGKQ